MKTSYNIFIHIYLIISLALCSCVDNCSVSIKNHEFIEILENYKSRNQLNYGKPIDFISVSIFLDNQDTLFGLYNSKYLVQEKYIGRALMNETNIYVYGEEKLIPNDLFEFCDYTAPLSTNQNPYSDTYTEFLLYSKGRWTIDEFSVIEENDPKNE